MSDLDGFAIRFLFASAGCLAAGLALWGTALLCRRRLPLLGQQRSTWLLAQLAVALTFALLLVPHGRPLPVVPTFEVDLAAVVTAAPASAAPTAAGTPAPRDDDVQPSWLALAARAWLSVYALGLGWSLLRLWRAQRALERLARLGERRHGASGRGDQRAAPDIIEIDAPIVPMLVGLLRPRLLLPRTLRDADPLQRELIVAHELTHWRRRDLWWLALATWLQALFWFNPAMRGLRAHLAWAQELGCDRDVLRGRPQAERKAYAGALLTQLRGQGTAHPPRYGALAFEGADPDTVAARLALIRAPLAGGSKWARCAGLIALVLAFGANLALQPALAWNAAAPIDCTIMVDAASGARLVEEGDCDVRATPVSTFNIAVSLMGYDSGILQDAHAPALPFKEGYADWLPSWRATTDPTGWIANSTVWYAQQVTGRLGDAALQDYVRRFGYGNGDLSGGVTQAWMGSSLQISPVEQAAFLRKVVRRELPVRAHAYDMTAQLLRLPALANGWQVHGKTGTASARLADGGEDPRRSYGWFVGWASKDGRAVVFARLVLDRRQDGGAAGPRLREAFLRTLPARLDRL